MTNPAGLAILISLGTMFALRAEGDNSTVSEIKFSENVEAKRAELQIRLSEPAKVEVEAKADGESFPVKYSAFGSNADDKAAILFLIDKSDPKRAKTIEAAKALIQRLVERADPRALCAVYAFDANLAPVSDFGATPPGVAAGLKKVKAVGMATELYRSAIEAIALLEKRPVRSRALMLFSDGKAEDTTYTLDQAIAAAKQAGVAIYGVGYAESPQSTIYLQSLRRLASGTGGLFAEADRRTRRVPEEFENTIYLRLESGGSAWVDLSGNKAAKQIEITVQAEGHEPFRQTFPLNKLAPTEEPTPVSTPDDGRTAEMAGKVEAMTKRMEEMAKQVAAVPTEVEEAAKKTAEARKAEETAKAEEASRQAKLKAAEEQAAEELRARKQKRVRILFATLGALALVSGLGLLLYKRRQRVLAVAAFENAPIFARLQELDGEGTEYPMRTTALRVGRGKGNDIALKNDSVSRHHAEIHRTREGVFTITELRAGNGVLVNGKPVEKATLKSEDVIELGEVRLRFLIA